MGFVGLLEFSLQCCDLLAWPLLALVYPLCCSIRAIEVNSLSDTQKLNSYWVVFSLILLFEHTFMKLLEWLPVWRYIRLVIVFWLVIPHFDGAFYVYKHLICPCLSMDLQIVINWFNKLKKSSSKRENFLAEVERYVKENGPEALEKIVASQLEKTESNPNVKELKAVSSMQNNESKSKEPNVAQKDIKAVQVSQTEPNLPGVENSRSVIRDIKEKAMGTTEDREILQTPSSKKVHEWTCAISQVTSQSDTTFNSHLDGKEYKSVYEALEITNQAELKLTQIGNSTFAASESKEKAVEVATSGEVIESSEKFQKEWTCALCQLTTKSEATLNFHLQGKKHIRKAACEALKAKNEAFSPNVAPDSSENVSHQPKEEPRKSRRSRRSKNFDNSQEQPAEGASSNGMKSNIVIDLKEKVDGQERNPNEVPKESTVSCNLCNVQCPSEIHLVSHLSGIKHQKKMLQRQQSPWKEALDKVATTTTEPKLSSAEELSWGWE